MSSPPASTRAMKPAMVGRRLLRALWRLVRTYWASKDAKWGALLLAGAVAFELLTVGANVLVSNGQRELGNALGSRDAAVFGQAVVYLLSFMGVLIVVSATRIYVRASLEIRWRRFLTAHYVERWMSKSAYCQSEMHQVDNPDQRIAEDVRDFVASALGLSLSLLSALVTLISFGGVLWSVSGDWTLAYVGKIPGFMLWVAIGFALFSTWLTHMLGRRLVPLNYDKIRLEADFRYGLVRFRDHVESVALSRGEDVERQGALDRFGRVVDNWWHLIRAQWNLNLLTTGIGQANQIVPILVAAPGYFAQVVTLGNILQVQFAYGQVSGALTWFVTAYQEIARWRANIERLAAFADMMDAADREVAAGGVQMVSDGDALRIDDLRLDGAGGRVLIEGAHAQVAAGERVALQGASGTGKTALFRAMAGLWPFGAGRIELPPRDRMLFVPQRPYLPLGTLRVVISYPAPSGTFPDERIREVLRELELEQLQDRLDEVAPWEQQLSDHEQQRIAVARVLLQKPDWVMLDEATSALDPTTEARVYDLVLASLPRAAVISIAARPGVIDDFPKRWTLERQQGGESTLKAA
jgi:vitamin B12/bleomycin/antimicrobial peptide transport system ATP-binding/permease protein